MTFLPLSSQFSQQIWETKQMSTVDAHVEKETLVFLNIAEVLMDTETSLGSQAWRKYLRKNAPALHDEITLEVFKKVPPKCPEAATVELIDRWQKRGAVVLALTSRGRQEWYGSQIEGIDALTEALLKQIGIDFSKTSLPDSFLKKAEEKFSEYYHAGIVYAGNEREQADVVVELFQLTGYKPTKIVAVNDKADALKTNLAAFQTLGIPYQGFVYPKTQDNHPNFDPMVANIQLDLLVKENRLISDEEAKSIKTAQYASKEPEEHFREVIKTWKARQ